MQSMKKLHLLQLLQQLTRQRDTNKQNQQRNTRIHVCTHCTDTGMNALSDEYLVSILAQTRQPLNTRQRNLIILNVTRTLLHH